MDKLDIVYHTTIAVVLLAIIILVVGIVVVPARSRFTYFCNSQSGLVAESRHKEFLFVENNSTEFKVMSDKEFNQHCGDK